MCSAINLHLRSDTVAEWRWQYPFAVCLVHIGNEQSCFATAPMPAFLRGCLPLSQSSFRPRLIVNVVRQPPLPRALSNNCSGASPSQCDIFLIEQGPSDLVSLNQYSADDWWNLLRRSFADLLNSSLARLMYGENFVVNSSQGSIGHHASFPLISWFIVIFDNPGISPVVAAEQKVLIHGAGWP